MYLRVVRDLALKSYSKAGDRDRVSVISFSPYCYRSVLSQSRRYIVSFCSGASESRANTGREKWDDGIGYMASKDFGGRAWRTDPMMVTLGNPSPPSSSSRSLSVCLSRFGDVIGTILFIARQSVCRTGTGGDEP